MWNQTISYIMAIYTVRMFGMSMVMMPIMTNGLNQLPMNLNPHGTAMNNTLQQVSGAIGTAIFLTIMNARMDNVSGKIIYRGYKSGSCSYNSQMHLHNSKRN